MGINKQTLALLLSEQKYRPITGDFLCIGKQTVNVPLDALLGLFERHGVPDRMMKDAIRQENMDVKTRHAGSSVYDHSLIKAMAGGNVKYNCLDVSDYEGADIIHDMTSPVPSSLHEKFDFIYNGSCMDNVFDPVSFIRNTSRMLKPNGRIIHIECAGAVAGAYLMFSPEWFFSYYAINEFVDCKVYVTIARNSTGHPAIFDTALYHWRPPFTRDPNYDYIEGCKSINGLMHVIVVAEKGAKSTSDANPMQSQYFGSSDRDWREMYPVFSESGRTLLKAPRHEEGKALPLLSDHYQYLGDGF